MITERKQAKARERRKRYEKARNIVRNNLAAMYRLGIVVRSRNVGWILHLFGNR